MNVSPTAELNFYVCSCSSLKMGLLRIWNTSGPCPVAKPWWDVLAKPTFFFFFPLLVLLKPPCPSSPPSSSALLAARASASSLAFSSSDFSLGATYSLGAKLATSKWKAVLMPDRFFKMNFYEDVLLIVQCGKLSIWRALLFEACSDFLLLAVTLAYVIFRAAAWSSCVS